MDYNDAGTTVAPIVIPDDAWTAITNDGAGAYTNSNYTPPGVTSLLDVTTGKIDPSQLELGDVLLIRNDHIVIPTDNNSLLEFRYTLGAGFGEYTLEKSSPRLSKGAGIEHRFALDTHIIYMGDDNTRNNPIGLEVRLSGGGTLINNGTMLAVLRHSSRTE